MITRLSPHQRRTERPLASPAISHYKLVLERKAEEIRRQVFLASSVLANPENNPDIEERANQTHEEWILLSCNRLGFRLQRQIQDALSRIEEGTYGLCQDCGERISHRRLDAVPWAERCVQCQDLRSAEAA